VPVPFAAEGFNVRVRKSVRHSQWHLPTSSLKIECDVVRLNLRRQVACFLTITLCVCELSAGYVRSIA
jgi:hypothetical protein